MMLRIILLIGAALWNTNSAAQGEAQAIRSPWVNESDPVWFVAKAPGTDVLVYAIQGRQQNLASLAYMDCLLLVNGTTGTCAALLSNEHVGIGSGFGISDYAEPISMARLNRRAQDNRLRNFVPVSVCGYEQRNGTVMFESMWMPSKTIDYQLQFDNQTQTMTNYQSQGYYVASLCSTKTINGSSNRPLSPNVVIIWHRLRQQQSQSVRPEQRFSIDVAESDCSAANTGESFYPVVMQLFSKGTAVRCSAVWQRMTAPSLKFELRIGSALADVVNMIDKRMQPRQISVYRDTMGREQIAVLWTNYSTMNISFDGSVFAPQDNISVNWLPGSTTGIKDKDKAKFESMVTTLMRASQIPALSFALSWNEQLKRAVSFGYANPLTKEAATVSTKFRLGSTSKPITAVAIFTLIDQGKLTLSSTVFGQGGVLGAEYGTKPYSQNVLKVKVVHLLEHTAGFGSRRTAEDVLFSFPDLNQSAYIGLVIDKYGPTAEPGTVFSYSNVGYYLLGVIITKLTGKPYDQYVKDALWRPSGVPDARVGITGRWFSERQPNEAMYYPDAGSAFYDAYDVIDPARVASAGGWIASPVDLLRTSTRMNGLRNKPDLLSANSYAEMTRPSNASGGAYCRGLFVGKEFFGFSHDGYYPGAFSRYQRQNNGLELSVVQSKADDTAETAQAVGTLIRLFIDLTSDWSMATQDLFTT